MKTMILILAAAGLAAAEGPNMKSASGGKEKQAIMFDGKMYVLKFIDQTKVVDLNEYYVKEETPENWTTMFSVSVYKTPLSPVELVKNMERGLLETHPDAPHDFAGSPDGKFALFMCMNWAGDRKTGSEFTVYRMEKDPRGVLAFQVSLRPYQAKVTTEEFKALKDRWAQKIQSGKFPGVTMQMP